MATIIEALKEDVDGIADCLTTDPQIERVIDSCISLVNRKLGTTFVITGLTEYADVDPLLYSAIVQYFQWYCCTKTLQSNAGQGMYKDGYNTVDKKGVGVGQKDVCMSLKLGFDDTVDQMQNECGGLYYGTSLVE